MSTTTKVFRSGNSQAVRIPKEFRIDAEEIEILRQGSTLILRPLSSNNRWPEGYLTSLAKDQADDSFVRAPQGEDRKIEEL